MKQTVGEIIRDLRKQRGWSQAELSRRAKLDPSHISRIEAGEYASPQRRNLEKIATAFNVSVADILGPDALTRKATPYDTNPRYRALLDLLDALAGDDRDRLLDQFTWLSQRLETAKASLPSVTEGTEAEPPKPDVSSAPSLPPPPVSPADVRSRRDPGHRANVSESVMSPAEAALLSHPQFSGNAKEKRIEQRKPSRKEEKNRGADGDKRG